MRAQGGLSFCYPRFLYSEFNQVPDCRHSCAVTLRVFLLPDGVLAQHRLGGPPTEVPIPFDPPHSSATCFGTLFFKPVFKPIQNSQALCERFWHTGNWSNSSTIMQLKNKSELLSNCSFQISRMSNQNRVHLCHDWLWFSGDVGIFSHPASATT